MVPGGRHGEMLDGLAGQIPEPRVAAFRSLHRTGGAAEEKEQQIAGNVFRAPAGLSCKLSGAS